MVQPYLHNYVLKFRKIFLRFLPQENIFVSNKNNLNYKSNAKKFVGVNVGVNDGVNVGVKLNKNLRFDLLKTPIGIYC